MSDSARVKTIHLIGMALLACGATLSLSCSSSKAKSAASLEAAEILELINEGVKRNDPHSDIEVDLGKFRVTHAVSQEDEVLLLVEFQLYAVMSKQKQAELEAVLPTYSNRIRDAVIALVQKIDTEHLTDPSLAFLKAQIVTTANRVLQDRLIKDVAFSDFSVHDAQNAPFPTTTGGGDEAKKPAAHGGHGH